MLFFREQLLLRTTVACSLRRILTVGGGGPQHRCIATGIETSSIKPKRSKYNIVKRVVSTLDPLHLQLSDFVDLSNAVRPTLTLPGMERPGLKSKIALFYHRDVTSLFPNNTRGFFYFHRPPGLPILASGLRFRVTPGTDPSPTNFEAGNDLLIPLGLPWQIPFPAIAKCSFTKGLRGHLLRSGAITQSQVDTCRRQFEDYLPVPYYTLYTLDQPFPVSFRASVINLCVVGREEVFRTKIPDPFTDKRKRPDGSLYLRPYGGSALAQLKVSTLPEHAGRNILIMEILKITQPVTCAIPGYDGYMPWPKEGSLLYHRSVSGRGVRSQLWVCDIDGASNASIGLRMLRDISSSRTLELQK